MTDVSREEIWSAMVASHDSPPTKDDDFTIGQIELYTHLFYTEDQKARLGYLFDVIFNQLVLEVSQKNKKQKLEKLLAGYTIPDILDHLSITYQDRSDGIHIYGQIL